jgi:histidinol-phosphatase (PHP family)
MRTNYHTHTCRCRHAIGTELDYVNEAVKKGLSILGFSDHGPYKNNRYGLRMDYRDLQPYIAAVNELKINRKSEITIHSGLEIEYDPREEDFYKELLIDHGLDYLALGQHFYISDEGQAINIYSITDTSQYIDYANSIAAAMASGYFKFAAHPDIMFVNNFSWDKNCEKACDIIISEADAHKYILEFNANGFRRGIHEFIDGSRLQYPHDRFWNKVAQTSIPVIIGSDCHEPGQVWDEVVEHAYAAAKAINLNIIDRIF